MPELPEVEQRRAFAERHLAGQTIERVVAARDTIVYEGVTPESFARKLTGRKVIHVLRKGKQIWFELDQRPWPTMHFGMGGNFYHYRSRGERPRYWKLELHTTEGTRLAMTNPRRLGRIRLLRDPPREPPISLLGPDPLYEPPTTRELAAILARRKAPIKAVLLNQSVLAGVGNWIADEVCYQSGIDPRRPARELKPAEVRKLGAKLRQVIRKAVSVSADSNRFPRTWLFHHRWGRDPEARTGRGEPVVFDTVGGRTTAWVPTRQR